MVKEAIAIKHTPSPMCNSNESFFDLNEPILDENGCLPLKDQKIRTLDLSKLDSRMDKGCIKIDASGNNIVRIRSLGNYSSQFLDINLRNNKMTSLENLQSLERLESLILSHNRLEHFAFINIPNLRMLDLGCCALREVTDLRKLTNLSWLSLHGNRISLLHGIQDHLPESIEYLDIGYNLIEDLTEFRSLCFFQNLKDLVVIGNPCEVYWLNQYRPYIISCIQPNCLTSIDHFPISEREQINGEKLHLDSTCRGFKPGTSAHKALCTFLESTTSDSFCRTPASTSRRLTFVLNERQRLNSTGFVEEQEKETKKVNNHDVFYQYSPKTRRPSKLHAQNSQTTFLAPTGSVRSNLSLIEEHTNTSSSVDSRKEDHRLEVPIVADENAKRAMSNGNRDREEETPDTVNALDEVVSTPETEEHSNLAIRSSSTSNFSTSTVLLSTSDTPAPGQVVVSTSTPECNSLLKARKQGSIVRRTTSAMRKKIFASNSVSKQRLSPCHSIVSSSPSVVLRNLKRQVETLASICQEQVELSVEMRIEIKILKDRFNRLVSPIPYDLKCVWSKEDPCDLIIDWKTAFHGFEDGECKIFLNDNELGIIKADFKQQALIRGIEPDDYKLSLQTVSARSDDGYLSSEKVDFQLKRNGDIIPFHKDDGNDKENKLLTK